ncbi:hypothetical protein ERX46_12935 [Brumimicrobium glaciale]|uniref:Outer membrane protein beta-barrel domain-containing protein n=1 Tax=Brumimicrobium glaciale TaxID=200475 RepID=A0A4Q4KI33_9FLAO|nr:hypothetical protein [Brumimicrobium glaciale]RYM32953.1 hypothetical protein ERX46_12935 [Brumimicrobium glaciale]
MKNIILFIAFIYISVSSLSQEKINLAIGFSSTLSDELSIISNNGSQSYFSLGLNLGADYGFDKGNFLILFNYKFESNIYAYSDTPKIENGIQYVSFNSLQRLHILGISLKYVFLNNEHDFRPFLKVSGFTEISTNYKYGFLLDNGFIPRSESGASYIYPPYPEDPEFDYYNSYFYNSTPLISSCLVGLDIKLLQNLNLNFAIGYGFRVMKVKYAEWKEDENVYEKLKTIPTKNINSQMFDVQLGLTYVFPRKSTPKPQ